MRTILSQLTAVVVEFLAFFDEFLRKFDRVLRIKGPIHPRDIDRRHQNRNRSKFKTKETRKIKAINTLELSRVNHIRGALFASNVVVKIKQNQLFTYFRIEKM